MTDEHDAIIRARYREYREACITLYDAENRHYEWPKWMLAIEWTSVRRDAEIMQAKADVAKALAKLLRALHDAGMGNAAPEGI